MARKKFLSPLQKINILEQAYRMAPTYTIVCLDGLMFEAAAALGFTDKDFSWEPEYSEYNLSELLFDIKKASNDEIGYEGLVIDMRYEEARKHIHNTLKELRSSLHKGNKTGKMAPSKNFEFRKENCLGIDGLTVDYEYIPADPGKKTGPETYAKTGDPGYPPEPSTVGILAITQEGVEIDHLFDRLDDLAGKTVDNVKKAYSPYKSLPPSHPLTDKLREELIEDAEEKLKEIG